jgi:hypothetical protein
MKILEEIQNTANIWEVPKEAMVMTYAHGEGLCIWWIRSTFGQGFKQQDFVSSALEFSGKGWWIRYEYDDMEWGCSFVRDQDQVDLGLSNFLMKMDDFLAHYTVLWKSEYSESPDTVNVVGVDYSYLASTQVNSQQKCLPEEVSNISQPFGHSRLRHVLFDGYDISDETQRQIIRHLIINKDDVIRFLRNSN